MGSEQDKPAGAGSRKKLDILIFSGLVLALACFVLTYNRQTEPESIASSVRNALGQIYYLSREYERAIPEYEKALDLDRSDPFLFGQGWERYFPVL